MMLPAVAKQLGPELTAYFTLRLAHSHIKAAYNDARIRLIYTDEFFYCCKGGRDLENLHAYVAQKGMSLQRKYPYRYT